MMLCASRLDDGRRGERPKGLFFTFKDNRKRQYPLETCGILRCKRESFKTAQTGANHEYSTGRDGEVKLQRKFDVKQTSGLIIPDFLCIDSYKTNLRLELFVND